MNFTLIGKGVGILGEESTERSIGISMEVALTRCHSVLMGKEFQGSASTAANALVWAFVVSVAAFGFELTNSTLGVDDYLWMQRDYNWNSGTVARGMWGYHLLHAVTPEGWVTPFITLLIGIALQVSTAVLAGWFIRLPHDRFACLFFFYAIWGTFPYFVAQMAFSYLQIGYAASSFLAVLGILIATGGRTSVKRIALGGFLIAVAISIYQGCIGLLGPVVLLRLGSELLQSEGGIYSCRKRMYSVLGKSAVSSLIGIALFTGVHKIVLVAFSIEPKSTRYSVSFDPFFWERWSTISTNMQLVAGGFWEVIPPAALVFLALSGCVGLGCLWSKSRNIVLPVQVLCLAGLAFVSIFAVSFVHPEGWLAPRSAVGVGFLWTAILSTPLLARPLWAPAGRSFPCKCSPPSLCLPRQHNVLLATPDARSRQDNDGQNSRESGTDIWRFNQPGAENHYPYRKIPPSELCVPPQIQRGRCWGLRISFTTVGLLCECLSSLNR